MYIIERLRFKQINLEREILTVDYTKSILGIRTMFHASTVSHNLPDWRGISIQLYHTVIAFARRFIVRRCIYDAFSVSLLLFPRGCDVYPEVHAFLLLRNFVPRPPLEQLLRKGGDILRATSKGQKPGEAFNFSWCCPATIKKRRRPVSRSLIE